MLVLCSYWVDIVVKGLRAWERAGKRQRGMTGRSQAALAAENTKSDPAMPRRTWGI